MSASSQGIYASDPPRRSAVPIARSRFIPSQYRRTRGIPDRRDGDLDIESLRVAIVCDWLLGLGGAERVILQFHRMFPEAPIITSQYDPVHFNWFSTAEIRATWLQRLPFAAKKFLGPLRALAFRQLDLSDYDLILTSSSAEAKAIRTRPGALQITYCHSPSRYYWADYDTYLESPGLGRFDPIGRIGLRSLIWPMRALDRRAARRAGILVANSAHIQDQIARHYEMPSRVIHPPVDIERFAAHARDADGRRGYVIAGRQTHYKRFDLAVEACTRLGLPLTVVGHGPEHARLRRAAGPTITFESDVDDARMPELLSRAEAFLSPGVEDFGITPVEAMATGTPVIAYRAGGALEYVHPGETGVFFDEPTVDSLAGALLHFRDFNADHDRIRWEADRFAPAKFQAKMHELIRWSWMLRTESTGAIGSDDANVGAPPEVISAGNVHAKSTLPIHSRWQVAR